MGIAGNDIVSASTGSHIGKFDGMGPPAIGPELNFFLFHNRFSETELQDRNKETGAVVWTFSPGPGLLRMVMPPLLVGATVDEVNFGGELLALDARSGGLLGTYKLGAQPDKAQIVVNKMASIPSAAGGLLVVPVGQRLVAFRSGPASCIVPLPIPLLCPSAPAAARY
jgi:outer membrane protein assembly factor BamB